MSSSWSQLGDINNLFTRLRTPEVLERAFHVFFHEPQVFAPLGALQALPSVCVLFVLTAFGPPTTDPTATDKSPEDAGTSPEETDFSSQLLVFLIVLLPLSFMVTMVGTGATIRATAEVYAKQQPKLRACLLEGFRRACALFVFGLALYLALVIGVFCLSLVTGVLAGGAVSLVGGDAGTVGMVAAILVSVATYGFVLIYAWSAVQVAPSSIVLERKSVVETMKRSLELVDGRRCYVFGAIFLLGLVGFGVGIGVQVASLIFGPAGQILLQFVWYSIALPVGSILATVMFFSLRVEKEGLNQDTLLHELGYAGSEKEASSG